MSNRSERENQTFSCCLVSLSCQLKDGSSSLLVYTGYRENSAATCSSNGETLDLDREPLVQITSYVSEMAKGNNAMKFRLNIILYSYNTKHQPSCQIYVKESTTSWVIWEWVVPLNCFVTIILFVFLHYIISPFFYYYAHLKYIRVCIPHFGHLWWNNNYILPSTQQILDNPCYI